MSNISATEIYNKALESGIVDTVEKQLSLESAIELCVSRSLDFDDFIPELSSSGYWSQQELETVRDALALFDGVTVYSEKNSLTAMIEKASRQATGTDSPSVKSVAHFAGNEEMRNAILESDALRQQTLNACYAIPGYTSLSKEDRNQLYDLVKKSIAQSQMKSNSIQVERQYFQ